MSEPEQERSDVVGGGCGGGDYDDGGGSSRRDDQEKQMGHVCEGHARKAKRVAFFRFRKVKKQLPGRNKRPSNPSSATTGCLGKWVCGGGGGCYLCFKQPQTLDSPVESQTSDPNSPEFSHELLKTLIEKNDFYSKECNPHLDINVDNTDEK
uniref:Uncharacterized protein n=1 Tax=Davidia involucrata TaxID=16924 RepID=A0A5B7BYF5_DAVIN